MPLDEYTIDLIKGKNLGIVVTLMPDGQPQALPTWIDTDGEYLLVNTEQILELNHEQLAGRAGQVAIDRGDRWRSIRVSLETLPSQCRDELPPSSLPHVAIAVLALR